MEGEKEVLGGKVLKQRCSLELIIQECHLVLAGGSAYNVFPAKINVILLRQNEGLQGRKKYRNITLLWDPWMMVEETLMKMYFLLQSNLENFLCFLLFFPPPYSVIPLAEMCSERASSPYIHHWSLWHLSVIALPPLCVHTRRSWMPAVISLLLRERGSERESERGRERERYA